jgi:hypothetical protein
MIYIVGSKDPGFPKTKRAAVGSPFLITETDFIHKINRSAGNQWAGWWHTDWD